MFKYRPNELPSQIQDVLRSLPDLSEKKLVFFFPDRYGRVYWPWSKGSDVPFYQNRWSLSLDQWVKNLNISFCIWRSKSRTSKVANDSENFSIVKVSCVFTFHHMCIEIKSAFCVCFSNYVEISSVISHHHVVPRLVQLSLQSYHKQYHMTDLIYTLQDTQQTVNNHQS